MNQKTKVAGAGLLLGGVLTSIGGQMHPRGEGETKVAYIASMLDQSSWAASHLASLVGWTITAVTLVIAYRHDVFGVRARSWVLSAAVGTGLAAVELLPHSAASSELGSLQSGGATPFLDAHNFLNLLATPALGLTTAALAVAVARTRQTTASTVLALVAVLSGVAYAFAGPLIALTDDLRVVLLFPAQAGVALWYLATGAAMLARQSAPTSRRDLVGAR